MARTWWKVEEYNDATILVDDQGKFSIKDEDGKILHEAETVPALKAQIRKNQPLDIDAYLHERWGSKPMLPVKVYAISGVGNLLYETPSGAKHKLTRSATLFVRDEARLKELTDHQTRAEYHRKKADALVNSWPTVKAPK